MKRLKKSGFFLAVVLAFNFNLLNALETINEGNVEGTWIKTNSPYQVNGDILVANGDTLIIEPGVTVEFMGHFRLTVDGVLLAAGTIGDSIRFTKTDTLDLSDRDTPDGSWNGVICNSGAVGVLSHCVIEYANPYDDKVSLQLQKSAVHGSMADLTLTNSRIRHNYGYHGGGARVWYGECEIRDNLFINNTAYYGAGGMELFSNSRKIVTGNRFVKNKGKSGGAIKISGGGMKIVIRDNFISQNQATSGAGIYVSGESGPQIIQNIIVNNHAINEGGGMYYNNSGKVLVNNTICNNFASNGASIYIYGPSLMNAANNILWGNRTSGDVVNNIHLTSEATATFRNCLLEGGSASTSGDADGITWENLIDENPSIQNPTAGSGNNYPSSPDDWSITSGSAGLNTGVRDYYRAEDHVLDFNGNNRIKYAYIDLGAFEFQQSSMVRNGTYGSDQFWIADTIKIYGDVILDGKTRIAPGVIVQFQNYYQIQYNDTVHAIGTVDVPILFTMADTTGFSDKTTTEGRWKGQRVEYADNARFIHCHFEYGEGITVWHSSDAVLEYCLFDHCMPEYFLIHLGYGSYHYIRNCIIQNTSTVFSGITSTIKDYYSTDLYIEHNQFYNNQIKVLEVYSNNSFIHNNLVYNNMGGVNVKGGDNYYFFNNTLAYNKDFGIFFKSGTGIIANNIIYGNEQDILTSSGIDELKIYNNILQQERPARDYEILEDNLIADPLFKNPVPVIGPTDNIESADYSVFSISPVINQGRNTIPGHTLPAYDIAGNDRILDGQVDIGAYEHTGQKPEITSQPAGGVICEGLAKVLSMTMAAEDTLLYQWQKDGQDISGANHDSLTIDPVKLSDAGNYRCMIQNTFGTTYSDQVYINVSSPAKILTEPTSTWIPPAKASTFSVSTVGSMPLNYQWYKDEMPIPEAILPELTINEPDTSDEGIYYFMVSNNCGADTTSRIQVYLAPQICMVTVSPTTGYNLAVWEKKSKAPIMAYHIYRESVAAGIYDRLATIPFDDLSVFVDTMADPTVQAYLYKITALDTAGIETDIDLCKPHKTIHLLVTTNPELNTTQLAWDRYYGFDYQTYTIYRSSTGVNFDPVHSMSASLNSWTDPDPSSGDLFFRIAVEKPDPCIPEGGDKKAGSGPYHHSLSNMDDNKLKAGQQPPDTITLSKNSIEEENLPGTMIGKLFTEDKDSIDSHTYQFVPGDGDNNNISFTLLGDLLLASESFDYETKPQYSVRIRSTDNSGNYCELPFIIQIIDVDETTGLPVLNAGAVKAFPNPFSRSTTVSFPNPSGESYRLVLTDLSGKVCRIVNEITTSEYVLEKGDLKEGFYFVELKGSRIYRGKIITE